ncbi:Calmodulin-related, putative isoform 2 [Melia azedarach]|uniref:Calmodulin-related, putative isoform 2 n=1 Tax=Melia azedarach TaxID=155640 RepID=A0ACC1YTW9_MELAZ|nr:Calmodulin-related, putative isoform 2 [Melia azedarach]
MLRLDQSDSELDDTENRSSEVESEEGNSNGRKQEEISEYEKQRLSRIAENKAKMEAMGLAKMASSLIGSPQNSKDHEEFLGNKVSTFAKGKVKNKSSKPKKTAPVQNQVSSSDYVADDDDELMQAIALSLQNYAEASGPTVSERKRNDRIQEDTRRGKRKKSFTSRVQMTEDEVILHFFQLDEAGKGSINMRDLRKVAVAHDFVWTDEELADMIHCFDSDGDGKLNLEDFQKIVSRCNMMRASEHS